MNNNSKIKNSNFVNIQGFMVNQLGLKKEQLFTYALIYGFTQDNESWFTGSLQYIADWLLVDRKNVYPRYLKPLIEKGLLEKDEVIVNGIKYVRYKAIVPSWVNLDDDTQNEDTILKKDNKCPQNEKNSVLNLRNNNISLNNINNKVVVNKQRISKAIDSAKLRMSEACRTDEYSNKAEQFMMDSFNCFTNPTQVLKINNLNDDDLISLFDVAFGLTYSDDSLYRNISNTKKFFCGEIKKRINNVILS